MIKLIRTDTTLDLSQKAEKSAPLYVEMIQRTNFEYNFLATATFI